MKDPVGAAPKVGWNYFVKARNLVAHQYDAYEPRYLWNIVHDFYPDLITFLDDLIANAGEP